MKVSILGDNLTSLALAKALVKKEIFVDLFYEKKNTKIDTTRTIGISKSNIDYFNKEISNIKKMLWPIKKIKIFTENSNDKEILKFEDRNDNLFSILQNQKIFNQLIIELKKNKFFKFKKYIKYRKSDNLSYDLIINCDIGNEITKKPIIHPVETPSKPYPLLIKKTSKIIFINKPKSIITNLLIS